METHESQNAQVNEAVYNPESDDLKRKEEQLLLNQNYPLGLAAGLVAGLAVYQGYKFSMIKKD